MQHKIKNNITHTQNKTSWCFNCLYQLARKTLFCKELYHRRLRLSLCRSPLSFLTCGGSYLVCPCCWIIPLTNNPFATVQGMRAPAGSPPGPAGAASPTLAFQSSSGLRCRSCVSSARQRLAGARERGPSEVPLQAQMLQLCQSVCRTWGVAAAASRSAPSAGGGTTFLSRGGKKRRWDLHAGIEREQMLSHRLSDYMCTYANTSVFNHKTILKHRGSLPHPACRCSVQTGAGAPAAPHTHISCPPRICVVRLSPVSRPGTFHTGPTGTKCGFMLPFCKFQHASLVFTLQVTVPSANLGSF